jgi:hypothetical protein
MVERMSPTSSVQQATRDARAVELSDAKRYARPVLVALWRKYNPETLTKHGPQTWSRDELVTAILDAEFPGGPHSRCWCTDDGPRSIAADAYTRTGVYLGELRDV